MCKKEYAHNQRKEHVCTAFPYIALILVATILAQIEVDLDQSWQSSFVSTLYITSLHLYLYLYYLKGKSSKGRRPLLYGVQRELYL